MDPLRALAGFIGKTFQFSGTSSPAEFWSYALFAAALLATAPWFLPVTDGGTHLFSSQQVRLGSLLALLPLPAIVRRRLRDAGWPATPLIVPAVALALAATSIGLSQPCGAACASHHTRVGISLVLLLLGYGLTVVGFFSSLFLALVLLVPTDPQSVPSHARQS